jgi:putative transposase
MPHPKTGCPILSAAHSAKVGVSTKIINSGTQPNPMPPRLKRYHEFGDHHFITFSCDQREPLLSDPSVRNIVEEELERVRKRFDWKIAGYVIMPEHIHLLTNEPSLCPLSLTMQRLKQQISIRHQSHGFTRLWLPRYYDFNVTTRTKYVEKLRYIHRNPVTRGLADSPEEYPWSSYRHYATGAPGVVTIEPA